MRAILLYNKAAGKGRIVRHIKRIVEIFAEQDIAMTPREIDFATNPFEGEEEVVELAVVCGGDGTINYVVNSMRSKGLNIVLGIIPAGTANDFAGALGMKRSIIGAARQIATGTEHKVDFCMLYHLLQSISIQYVFLFSVGFYLGQNLLRECLLC